MLKRRKSIENFAQKRGARVCGRGAANAVGDASEASDIQDIRDAETASLFEWRRSVNIYAKYSVYFV